MSEFNLDVVKEEDEASIEKDKLSKEEKVQVERRELLNRVLSGNIKSLRDRVGYVLNNEPKTRN